MSTEDKPEKKGRPSPSEIVEGRKIGNFGEFSSGKTVPSDAAIKNRSLKQRWHSKSLEEHFEHVYRACGWCEDTRTSDGSEGMRQFRVGWKELSEMPHLIKAESLPKARSTMRALLTLATLEPTESCPYQHRCGGADELDIKGNAQPPLFPQGVVQVRVCPGILR